MKRIQESLAKNPNQDIKSLVDRGLCRDLGVSFVFLDKWVKQERARIERLQERGFARADHRKKPRQKSRLRRAQKFKRDKYQEKGHKRISQAITVLFILGCIVSLYIWREESFEITNHLLMKFNIRIPSYYYGWAKTYVSETYLVPEDRDIEGLVDFLDQLIFPKYELHVFDCSDSSALLEWLLEGAGFHAYICVVEGMGQLGELDKHSWVQVETSDGIVAIEAVELTEGWGLEEYDAKPTGIIEKPDGTFREFTYDYRVFLKWKKKYPPSIYEYDPNISFEEWYRRYRGSKPPIASPIPTISGYYTESRYESPTFSFGWWDVYPYSEIYPFSEWRLF